MDKGSDIVFNYNPYNPYNAFSNNSLYNPASAGLGYGQPAIKQEITRVNGGAGARTYASHMAQDSSALLLDESEPLVWLAQTDGAGYPTLTPYSIKPHQPEQQINTNDLERRIKKLEDLIYESNTSNAEQPAKQQYSFPVQSDKEHAQRKESGRHV